MKPTKVTTIDSILANYTEMVRHRMPDDSSPKNWFGTLEAKAQLEQLLIEARINSLLDLEQWAKLHDLDKEMILEGIEHMCISLIQVPDQPHLDHSDRINDLNNKAKGE